MSYTVEVGKSIVELRKDQSMTQEVLAFDSNLSVSRLRDIEHGRANPSLDTLESLAKTLGLELVDLMAYHLDRSSFERILEETRKDLGLFDE